LLAGAGYTRETAALGTTASSYYDKKRKQIGTKF
jgi:hypothetical protein